MRTPLEEILHRARAELNADDEVLAGEFAGLGVLILTPSRVIVGRPGLGGAPMIDVFEYDVVEDWRPVSESRLLELTLHGRAMPLVLAFKDPGTTFRAAEALRREVRPRQAALGVDRNAFRRNRRDREARWGVIGGLALLAAYVTVMSLWLDWSPLAFSVAIVIGLISVWRAWQQRHDLKPSRWDRPHG